MWLVWNILPKRSSFKRHKTGGGCSEGVEIQVDDTIKEDDNENDVKILDADDSGEEERPILNNFDLLNNPTFNRW